MRALKNAALIFMFFLGLVNKITPKLNIIIFFTNNKEFNDNNKALLRKIIELGIENKYIIYSFSKDKYKYKNHNKVKYKSTLLAPLYFLFSKYCFYDCGTLKIRPSRNQYVISLWHGVPLKKIGLMLSEQSSKLDRYNDFSKILIPSKLWVETYKKCFGCNDEQIMINGFPRNDFLFHPNFKSLDLLGIPSDNSKTNILWMPTFRASIGGRYKDSTDKQWDLPLFNGFDELESFNNLLKKSGARLIIKIHPYSTLNLNTPNNLTNIFFVKNTDLNKQRVINYEFVSCFDALITDYSSIFFDYLLINKPIAFTMDDFDDYHRKRGFTVSNPEKYLVGKKILNSSDLFSFINSLIKNEDFYLTERNNLKKETHEYIDDQSTIRLLKEIKLL